MDRRNRCPRCGSPSSHLHPAVQCGGEVQVCPHDFHLTPTPQNTDAYIGAVLIERNRRATPFALEATDDQ